MRMGREPESALAIPSRLENFGLDFRQPSMPDASQLYGVGYL